MISLHNLFFFFIAETAVQNNEDRQAIVDENMKRTKTMAKHIRDLEQDKKLQVRS